MWYGSELLLNMVARQPFFQDCISSQVSHNQAKSKKKKIGKKNNHTTNIDWLSNSLYLDPYTHYGTFI